MHLHRIALLLCGTLLVACGGDKAGTAGAAGEDGLPKPAAASGSVTGMPDPGVAGRRPAAATRAADNVEQPGDAPDGEIAPVDPVGMPAETASEVPADLAVPQDAGAPATGDATTADTPNPDPTQH